MSRCLFSIFGRLPVDVSANGICMDKGVIVEQGSFGQLMDKKGLFYELAGRQMA